MAAEASRQIAYHAAYLDHLQTEQLITQVTSIESQVLQSYQVRLDQAQRALKIKQGRQMYKQQFAEFIQDCYKFIYLAHKERLNIFTSEMYQRNSAMSFLKLIQDLKDMIINRVWVHY